MFFEKNAGEDRGKITSFSANLTSQWLGTLYTAAVSLGLTFLLGRVLGPEGFGAYSYVLTLATLFLILQDGGFKTLLFREKTLSTPAIAGLKNRLFPWALGHTVMITMAGVFFVLILPVRYDAGVLAAILCFGFQGWVNFISSELKGEGLFPREALWQVTVRTLSAIGIVVALFFVRPEPWAIFSGWAFALLVCLFLSPKRIVRPAFDGFRFKDIRRACFSLMAIDAATTLYFRSDIILLEHFSNGSTEVGYYAAAYRFLDGVVLFAAPLGFIWFRKLRLVWEEKEIFRSQIVRMCVVMFGAACLCVSGGVFFKKEIIDLTFGDGYGTSAILLPWLLAALIFILPNGVLTQAAIAQNIEHLYAVAAGAAALVNIGLNFVLIPRFGGLGAAWATIVTEAALMAVLVFGLTKKLKRSEF
jgi:O-antigen/teichoic acid export membrane protein